MGHLSYYIGLPNNISQCHCIDGIKLDEDRKKDNRRLPR